MLGVCALHHFVIIHYLLHTDFSPFASHGDENADAASKGHLCVSAVTLMGPVTLTFLFSVLHPALPDKRRRRLLAEWNPIKAAAMQTTA